MRHAHALALLIGTLVFVALLAHVGPARLWHDAAVLGWGVAIIIAIEGVADFLHTFAWQRCFAPGHRPATLRLWWPHLAGAAINFVTPTATLGGEVVRGTLVPAEVPGTEATASLAINKLAATLSDAVLAVAGVVLLLWTVDLAPEVRGGVLAGTGLFGAGVFAFLVVQRRGRLVALLGERRTFARLLGAERAGRFARAAAEIDTRIARFHAERPGDLAASVALHVAGSALGAVQLWVFLRWLSAPADVSIVALVFLVARVLDLAAFFVPARLGAQEGARMLAMRLAGLDPSLGLLFSLVLRLEQVTWAAAGFAAYAVLAAGRGRSVRAVS
ncbi:MAG: flippase-like domain-containing protein [Deltaproteobacteria bacterium]|nr:flippase-like domain-containing protein [Deltaproteobacteria bacterium]